MSKAKGQSEYSWGKRLRLSWLNRPIAFEDGLMGVGVVAIAFFTLLPLSYYRMVGWPWIAIWQFGFLAIGGALILALRRSRRPVLPLGYGWDAIAALTLVGLLLSTLVAPFKTVALWNLLLTLNYGLLFYAGAQWLRQDSGRLQKLWVGLVGLAVSTAVVSLSLWRPTPDMWQANNFAAAIRNHQPLGHHNFVGGYFALVLPLTVSLALAQSGWRRGVGLGGAGLVLAALYVSGSRGAALGMLVWAMVSFGAKVFAVEGSHRLQRGFIGALLLALLLGGLATNPRVRNLAQSITFQRDQPTIVIIEDGPAVDRWFMLRMAVNLLRDRPLGVGPGNLGRVSNLYRPLETGTGLDHIQQLHNLPAQLAGELGFLGLLLWLGWLGVVARLAWRLRQTRLSPADRWLLRGICGSVLAYGISSLTDYQLENIGLASMLVGLGLLLLGLADRYQLPPPPLRHEQRRWLSLGCLVLIALLVYTWLPFDLALALGQSGTQALAQDRLITANNRWLKATTLAPWDPTFSALAAEELLAIESIIDNADSQTTLQQMVLDYSQRAQAAAPYDVWFNQNLAVLTLSVDAVKAEYYASRAAQLLPRSPNFTYYLLGLTYLAQNKTDLAVNAFVLESLVRPEFITYPIWEDSPFLALRDQVVDAVMQEYDRLLSELSPQHPAYQMGVEQRALTAWWHDRPVEDSLALNPLLQVLLLADAQPQRALERVNQTLVGNPANASGLALLRAWLAPHLYLDDYLADADLSIAEQQILSQQVSQQRDLLMWLRSMTQVPSALYRGAMAFAYRNQSASDIRLMLRPSPLREYGLLRSLGLVQKWPREFPWLDRRIETLRAERLGLPHPTRTHFRLMDRDGTGD